MVDLMILIIQPKGCLVKNTSISGRHGLVFQHDFFQNLAFHFQCSATFFFHYFFLERTRSIIQVLLCNTHKVLSIKYNRPEIPRLGFLF